MAHGSGDVIDLRVARGLRDTGHVARERFARARQACGLPPEAFAVALTQVLGWPVTAHMVTAWESRIVAMADALIAAEFLAEIRSPAAEVTALRVATTPDEQAGGLDWPATVPATRTAVTELWQSVSQDRVQPAWASQAATHAGWRWSFDPPDPDVSGAGTRRVTSSDIRRLQDAMTAVVTLDRQFGGGHVQPFLLTLLTSQVTPLLHGRYGDRDGRDMFDAASELTAQLGFSAYDAGRHGLAERSYIQALRLAKAAGDKQLGTHILANMATQAVGLRRPAEALQLARAAAAGVGRGTHPTVLAHVHTVEASAHAIAGDRPAFRRALHAAERAITRPRLDPAPQWARYFTPAHWAGTAVRGMRDLGLAQEALDHEEQALALDGANTRTRALHSALLATVHAAAGHVDRACELAHASLDTADGVQSDRVVRRLATLQRQLESHRAAAGVEDVLDRITGAAG